MHKARLRQVLDHAIAFYHAVLTGSKSGEAARDYLRGRGFTDETIAAHQLGWAPGGWDTLVTQLGAKRDVRSEELVEVGLASPRQRGTGVYDKFRARVIFPIRDQNGHAVGLGGRLLEGEGPKYLNSPATPLFDKSRTLYLIDRAKGPIRKSGQAVIVEGYTDALMAHQAGFDNVVASLGTALTPGQVALLTRYARRIALAYDVDAAGERAGTLGVQALAGLIGQLSSPEETGVKLEDVRVVRLPDGKDPDEVVREAPDTWRDRIAAAKPIVEYLIGHHAERFDLKTSSGRIGFVEAVMPTLRDIADPLRRDEALQEVHRVSGVEARAAPGPGPTACRDPGPRAGRADHRRRGAGVARCAGRRHPARDHAGGDAPAAAPPARPGPASPCRRPARPRPAPEHRRARAVPGDRRPARPGRPRRPSAVRLGGPVARPR